MSLSLLKFGLEQMLSPKASLSPRKRQRPREDPTSPLEAKEEPPGPPVKRMRIDPALMEAALQDLNSPKAQKRDVRSMEEPNQVADPRGDYKKWSEDLIEAIIKQGGDPQMVMSADIRSWYNIASNPGAHRSRG